MAERRQGVTSFVMVDVGETFLDPGDLLGPVGRGERVVFCRRGAAVAVLVPLADYARLERARRREDGLDPPPDFRTPGRRSFS